MKSRRKHNPLQDEQGDWSFARIGLMVTMGFTFGIIAADTFWSALTVPTPAYSLLGGLLTGLMAWAGGRAIARYLGPQVAGVVQGIASAKGYVADDTLPRRMPPDPE